MKFPAPLDISHIEMGMVNNLGVGLKKNLHQDFLGSPVVKIPHFQCRDVGFITGQGTKIPCDTWHSQKKLKVKKKKRKEPIPKAHSKTLKIRIPGIKSQVSVLLKPLLNDSSVKP